MAPSRDHELLEEELGRESTEPVDFVFLRTQTFGDLELERDLLGLFVAQARRVLPTLPGLAPQAQNDAAHLLKGSARGIGAWPAARSAAAYEAAALPQRVEAYKRMAQAFAAAATAIDARLA